jgi:hypothetical protein
LVQNIDIRHIVALCEALKSLTLSECPLLQIEANTWFNPRLPHFQNLISLQITDAFQHEDIYRFIRRYVSLKTIHLELFNIFTVEFLREVQANATLKNLENIYIIEYDDGAMTIEALDALIQHCTNLKSIQGLHSCPLIDRDVLEERKTGMLARNYDLLLVD